MKSQYLHVPLNTSMRDWYRKWFYVEQELEPLTPCDPAQIPETRETWSEKPNTSDMVQVEKLLKLINRAELDGPMVAANFMFRRIQPCKDRVHQMFGYDGSQDATRETPDELPSKEINKHLADLFVMSGYKVLAKGQRAFKLTLPPPQVEKPNFLILTSCTCDMNCNRLALIVTLVLMLFKIRGQD